MAFTNVHRGVRMSPKKVQTLIPLIRGMKIDEAVTLMEVCKQRAAVFIRQALLAAKANADQAEADVRKLVVTEARVDDGPRMKRFQPKDRGRSHSIIKRTCHITVAVDVKGEKQGTPARKKSA